MEGQAPEDAPSLVARMRSGVDRPHGPHPVAGAVVLPPQEGAEPDDPVTIERDPSG